MGKNMTVFCDKNSMDNNDNTTPETVSGVSINNPVEYRARKSAGKAKGREIAKAVAIIRETTGESVVPSAGVRPDGRRVLRVAWLDREWAIPWAAPRQEPRGLTGMAWALEMKTWGRITWRHVGPCLHRGIDPNSRPVREWSAAGVPAALILWRWKVLDPSAKSAGEAARRMAERPRQDLLDLCDKQVLEAATAKGLVEEDEDEVGNLSTRLDPDAHEAVMGLDLDAGMPAIQRALAGVAKEREREAISEGAEVIGRMLDDYLDVPDRWALPEGWRWARPGDEAGLARWVAKTNACLVRALMGEMGYDVDPVALALGPQRQVVGFALVGMADGGIGLLCDNRGWCVDVNNGHDAQAWDEWAVYPLEPKFDESPLEEDPDLDLFEVEEQLLAC